MNKIAIERKTDDATILWLACTMQLFGKDDIHQISLKTVYSFIWLEVNDLCCFWLIIPIYMTGP